MATQALGVTKTYEAAADLSSYQYYLVKVSADGKVNVAGANEKAIGILQNEPESGDEAVVAVSGISKFVCSETIAVGKYVTATSAGKGEIADAAGEHAVGVCTRSTSTDGDIGELLISPFTAHASDA